MTFDEIIEQVRELLQSKGRVAYRALKRRYELDDEYIEDIKGELIDADQVAQDEDGKVLVWIGEEASGGTQKQVGVASAQEGEAPQTPVPRSEAERRQLTVMFCDLVGSTNLSGQLDPEELREVVQAHQQTSAEIIERYEGHIAQYLGDGLLVYFGYPTAHEDDASRAVRAGLAIVGAIRELPLSLPQPLHVRVGIHTGLVVVGEMGGGGRHEQLALGETPNIAARVQGQAQPDEVVISTATYQLVEGLFICEDRGRPELKGVTTPLTLYRVTRESEAQSRFQVVARQGLTPLVGREHEHGLLRERWQQAKDGAGQVVLLCGEPGIGKSRLVEQLKETVELEGARCLELRCSSYSQNSALQPVIEHFQRQLQLSSHDSPKRNLEKLRQGLGQYRFPQADTLPLLAALLSLPHPEDVPPLSMSPQKQKDKTYEAVVAWLCEETPQAVAYAWEDLHWADPSTLELLSLFLDQVPTHRLLAVLTYRPEFIPPWGAHSYLSQLTLNRLGRDHVETMAKKVTGGKSLPAEVIQHIADKTDGVPLFVEELTKMVMESDFIQEVNGHYELSGPLPPLAIPSTLQDSLMARLDRLADVREIAQLGATIGREFQYSLLRSVSPLDERTLQHGLQQLVEAELVFQSGVPPQAQYLFKHALIQDTAYQSLLKRRRRQLHKHVAQVLAERLSETTDTQPELVAHHYTEAGLGEQAIPYWQQAGQRAVERSANMEAVRHLTQAVELVKTLPDSSQRAQQELALQTALGVPLQTIKGWGDTDVVATYNRARQLCQQIGDTPQLFPTLFGLWRYYLQRVEFKTAHELAKQLEHIARRQHDHSLLMEAQRALGSTLFFMGDLPQAQTYAEQSIALYDAHKGHSRVALFNDHPGVICRLYVAHILWLCGYPDQAQQQSDEALALARKIAQPASLAYALAWKGLLHQYRREAALFQELIEELIALAAENAFGLWLATAPVFINWAVAIQDSHEGSVSAIQQGLAAHRASGSENMRPYMLSMLTEVHWLKGQRTEAGLALDEALAAVDSSGARYYEAELLRLKGEIARHQSQVEEAESYFQNAREIARQQKSKSLELRTATSLAQLRQQQGRNAGSAPGIIRNLQLVHRRF